MLLSASFVAFLSMISIGSTEKGETFDYNSLKEVGSIYPFGCYLMGVHIISDFIYVHCQSRYFVGTVGHFRQYEKQKPFDLLSFILTFDIEVNYWIIGSQYSEVSNCFYIYEHRSKVWRIGIDDHSVTTFLSISDWITSMAIASNGQLFILVRSSDWMTISLRMYASDATFIGDIELSHLKGSPSIFHVGGNSILMSNFYRYNRAPKSWLGFWSIDKLIGGIDGGDFIWKQEVLDLKRTVIRVTISQGENSEYSFSYSQWEWLDETMSSRATLYFDPYSNTTRNVSEDDLGGGLGIVKYLLSSYIDSDQNMVFVCKERNYEMEFFESNGDEVEKSFKNDMRIRIVLMYKCLNQTSWCQKKLETFENMPTLEHNCMRYTRLHASQGYLFIKPLSHNTCHFFNALVIYTVK